MSIVTTPRILLPTICKGLSQSLAISGAFGARQKSKKSARRKQPPPFASTGRGKSRPPPWKTTVKKTALQIHSAAEIYSTQNLDSLPNMEHPQMDEPTCNKTRVRNETRREAIEQARSQAVEGKAGKTGKAGKAEQSGGFNRRPPDGEPPNPGAGVGVGGNQMPLRWTPFNTTMGSNGGSNGMIPQSYSTQNTFNPLNMGMAQDNFAYNGFQLPFFTSSMGTHFNLPQAPFANYATPSLQLSLQSLSLFNGGQYPAHTLNNTSAPSIHNHATSLNALHPHTTRANTSKGRHQIPITPPSAASGGIPEPAGAYLLRASFLPRRRDQPGPLLVVIDLNGTLLYRRNGNSTFEGRAHATAFVDYCVRTFWVVIWSSAKPANVTRMVAQLLPAPDLRSQVVAVWGRDKFGLAPADYEKRTQCYKRLTRLWADPEIQRAFPSSRPGFEGGCWDQGNTVLIDDSVEKARSEPHNAITLPEFTGGTDGDGVDVLPAVHDYLNQLCFQEDASAYMRAHPFKMPERVNTW